MSHSLKAIKHDNRSTSAVRVRLLRAGSAQPILAWAIGPWGHYCWLAPPFGEIIALTSKDELSVSIETATAVDGGPVLYWDDDPIDWLDGIDVMAELEATARARAALLGNV